MVSFIGQTEEPIKESGNKGSNMGKEFTLVPKVKREREHG